MAKREKCKHGNVLLKMQGCAYCVSDAMTAWNYFRRLGVSVAEMHHILQTKFKNEDEWKSAKGEAAEWLKKEIET